VILYQTWTGDYPFTCKFIFNSDGYLLKELSSPYGSSRTIIKTYEYDSNKKLIEEIEITQREGKTEQKKVTNFFCSSDGIIDSAYSEINSLEQGQFQVVICYDNFGLRTEKAEQDSLLIKYTHHKRSGV
jgi:hypothetical protein